MRAERLSPFDEAEGLDSPAEIAAYLNAVLAEADPELLAHALGVIGRARGLPMPSGVATSDFEAVRKPLESVGVRLHAEAA